MKATIWTKITASKRVYPTRIIGDGRHGHLVLGSDAAKAHIERVQGFSVSKLRPCHTRTQWRWSWPKGTNPRSYCYEKGQA